MTRIAVALGGNALIRRGQPGRPRSSGEPPGCRPLARRSCGAERCRDRAHPRNGPQVGFLAIAAEMASSVVPAPPLDVLGAESQARSVISLPRRSTTRSWHAGSGARSRWSSRRSWCGGRPGLHRADQAGRAGVRGVRGARARRGPGVGDCAGRRALAAGRRVAGALRILEARQSARSWRPAPSSSLPVAAASPSWSCPTAATRVARPLSTRTSPRSCSPVPSARTG